MHPLVEKLTRSQIAIVIGHYGSGKTEFSLNLAFDAAASGKRTALADLDIVNPYFRSRELAPKLEESGIPVLSTNAMAQATDLPALSAGVQAAFDDKELFTVFDVGGDPVGAKVLGRYRENIEVIPYEMIAVVNGSRPQTKTAEAAENYLRAIEIASGLKITGLVNNTHLIQYTEVETIETGQALINELSERTGIPVLANLVPKQLLETAQGRIENIFPLEIYMKKPWEK